MKIFKSLSITGLALSLLTLSFCTTEDPQPMPTACFTIDSLNAVTYPGDTIQFTTCSKEVDSYFWDFGDSMTSNMSSPTHVYTSSGTFEVTLRTTNSSGTKTMTETVVITEKTPVEMTISKITIRKWPALTSFGQPWDPSPDLGPDLFYYFSENGINVIMASEYKTDCVDGTEYSFMQDFPYSTINMNATYKTNFYDFDGTGLKELMGGISFVPMDAHDDGVAIIHLEDGTWDFDVHVTWVY